MVKWISTIVLSVLLLAPATAQQWKLKRMEGALGIGITNLYGDMGGTPEASNLFFIRDITFRTTRPSVYGAVRYRISPRSSVKASLIYGFSKNEDYSGARNSEELRGFKSTTHLVEIGGNYEFYIIPEFRVMRSAAMFSRRGMINDYSSLGLYVFTGLAANIYKASDFQFPDEFPNGRPNDQYKLNTGFTGALPVGAGLKFVISDKWILGYEMGYRQSFTDYMDGLKTPWSKSWDGYWISTLNLIYRIPTSRRGLPYFLDPAWRHARF